MTSAYQGGILVPHNHTATPGDGGQLASPDMTIDASTPAGIPTFRQLMLVSLLFGI